MQRNDRVSTATITLKVDLYWFRCTGFEINVEDERHCALWLYGACHQHAPHPRCLGYVINIQYSTHNKEEREYNDIELLLFPTVHIRSKLSRSHPELVRTDEYPLFFLIHVPLCHHSNYRCYERKDMRGLTCEDYKQRDYCNTKGYYMTERTKNQAIVRVTVTIHEC